MNPYPYINQPFFSSPEEAALYFNSIRQYGPGQDLSFGRQVYPFVGQPMNSSFYQPILSFQKPEFALDGPTMDKEPTLVKIEEVDEAIHIKFKKPPVPSPSPSDSASNYSDVLAKPPYPKVPKSTCCTRKRKSNPKKNT